MTRVVDADSPLAVEDAARVLERGGLVVIPTDTVYGLAALPHNTARIFEVKKRAREIPLPVLVAGIDQADRLAKFTLESRQEAMMTWPGGWTVVLLRTVESASFDLGEERGTIGLRVPDDEFALALLEKTGPLAVTSANLSGEPMPKDIESISAIFGEAVDLYIDDGPRRENPSTVVSHVDGRTVLRD